MEKGSEPSFFSKLEIILHQEGVVCTGEMVGPFSRNRIFFGKNVNLNFEIRNSFYSSI